MSVKKIQKRQKHTHVLKKLKHAPKVNKNTDKNAIINNNKNNNKETDIKKSFKKNKKSLVIAHEIKFAKLLAGNDKKVRDKVLKNLKKWLAIRSQSSFAFVEQDFMRLWKGLYYCMWMSDKPLIQEELAESLSKLVHCFNDNEAALLYTKCTLSTLASEWFGLDHYRLDKFQMLARRIIRQTFIMCKKRTWDRRLINGVVKIIENTLLDSRISLGFSLHITELYMEELAKVSGGNIPEEIVIELIRPFAIQLAGMDDERKIRHVMKHIFRYLIFQSDVGLDYTEKFEAWRHAGFPKGNIDAMEKVEVEEDDEGNSNDDDEDDDDDDHDQSNESDEKPLDPRAGRVDVELPQLPFDPKAVANLVMEYRFHSSSTTKTRRQILRIAKEFNELSEGKMPLGVKEVKLRDGSKAETNPRGAALRLLKFEQELYSDTIKGRRKKKSRRTEELEEENEEEEEDIDSDLGSPQPRKKKIKSETSLNTKTGNDEKSKSSADKIPANLDKVKSKVAEQSKKKKGTSKTTENGVSDIVMETPKRKRGKNVKRNENSGSTAETNLLQNGTPQNLKLDRSQTMGKHKHINCEHGAKNSELISSHIKKSGFINSAKKLKRNSSEGSWSISEVVNPVSPTTKDPPTGTTTSSSENNRHSIDQIQSNKSLSLGTPSKTKETPKKVMMEISKSKKSVLTPEIKMIQKTPSSSTKKKVKIVLQRNTAQHTSEYHRQLRRSPAIPFDANRKPPVGVLKPSPIPSPVNPFYKRLSFK